ncbi:MAG: 6-phosphofructo-2-kinase/fructose-2,6-bisphosphatase, partial [Myxococcota bacterium]
MRTLASNDPLVLVMVGLPARGKTFIARKVARYLAWLGREARVFNVGNYRRRRLGPTQPASFFDPDNPEGASARRDLASAALDDLVAWLREGLGRVGIYDATNATRERRDWVAAQLAVHGLTPVFVESVCTDPAIVEANIRETKLSMPDYAGVDPDRAVADFRARIAHYERAYEPVDEDDRSWVKLVDVGHRVVSNEIHGYLASRVVLFVANLHITPRPIVLVRHGESAFNVARRIGGDPSLTDRGRAFATRFATWAAARFDKRPEVWTSTLQRTIETARALPWPSTPVRNLDEIDAGQFDGWTYDEVAARHPDEAAARRTDKLRYRYPRGESYEDVISRLEPVIIELERQRDPVVVVAHQAVIRCLYAYLAGRSPEECPHLEVPLHTAIVLVPRAYGPREERIPLEG